ncbi:MAG: VCBS repeat-containing protein [Anaerolineae bacterium]|nr:VCBS repeat-containing protein [Candidatus Bipolaricaulota bacterium]MDW8069613.1 VCBS repeat-containing protein [Anaerolineae bacterium]MDW8151309.1 VCBS repeat-containing protein [Candidatus Bipolaricaulota bacterium]
MRGKWTWASVWAVFLLLGFEGLAEALLLWEPSWSPVVLKPGRPLLQPALDRPNAFAAADLDGNGVKELVVGGDYLHHLYLHPEGTLFNSYLLAFLGYRRHAGPGGEILSVVSLAAGDLTGDGLDDLVVASLAGKVWILGNHGRWGLQAHAAVDLSAHGVWVWDGDGDGISDVLCATTPGLEVLLGDGQGGVRRRVALPGPPGRKAFGGQGTWRGAPGFFLLAEDGVWFVPQGLGELQRVWEGKAGSLGVADLDGDGASDLLLGDPRVGPLRLLWAGKEEAGFALPHGAGWILVGDVTRDGLPDLVLGRISPAGYSVLVNRGKREFTGPFTFGVQVPALGGFPPMAPKGILLDLEGDGRADLVVEASPYHLAFFLSGAQGRVLQEIPGSFLLGRADLNPDGFPDLLFQEGTGVAVLWSTGLGTFRAQTLIPTVYNLEKAAPYLAKLGDVTGDGQEELVVWEFWEGRFPIWDPKTRTWRYEEYKARLTAWDPRKPTDPLWSLPTGLLVRPVLEIFDLDGDGIRDGVTVVGTTLLGLNFDPARRLQPPDFGLKRILVEASGTVGPLVLLRLGEGERLALLRLTTRTELLLVQPGGRLEETGVALELVPLDLGVADLNRDGNEDLVAIGWGAVEEEGKPGLRIVVAVLLGDGRGGFTPQLFPVAGWPPLALPFPYGGLALGDLDGDGDPDLACTRLPDREGNPGGIVVLLWEGQGFGPMEFLPSCVGTKLLALDVDGDGRAELLTVQEGLPAYLCLTRR